MRVCLSLILPLLLSWPVMAQDVQTGPAKGEKVPALKVLDLTGLHKDKEVDYAAERKDKPTIYLLIRADKFDRPMNRFMKKLDDTVKKDYEDTYMVAVWLTETVDATKDRLPKIQQSVQYEMTALTLFSGEKTGPKD